MHHVVNISDMLMRLQLRGYRCTVSTCEESRESSRPQSSSSLGKRSEKLGKPPKNTVRQFSSGSAG